MTIRGTSYGAARAIRGRAKTLRAKVFAFILQRGHLGATLQEMEQTLGMAGNTVRPRRIELEEKGWVQDSGRRRPTDSGKAAIVWVVPEPIASSALAKLKTKGITL